MIKTETLITKPKLNYNFTDSTNCIKAAMNVTMAKYASTCVKGFFFLLPVKQTNDIFRRISLKKH